MKTDRKRGFSSHGRARPSQGRGKGIDTLNLHSFLHRFLFFDSSDGVVAFGIVFFLTVAATLDRPAPSLSEGVSLCRLFPRLNEAFSSEWSRRMSVGVVWCRVFPLPFE